MSYRITAQAMVGSQRIAKVVQAGSADTALRSVAAELEEAGFYAVSVTPA